MDFRCYFHCEGLV